MKKIARILNISRRGLLVRSAKTPVRGSYVEICRGTHRIVARVVWVSQDQFGLRTQDAIALDTVVKGEDAALPVPANDRRSLPRLRSDDRHERSRRWSRWLEYLGLALFAGAAAVLAFDGVRATLSRPLNIIDGIL